MLTIAEPFGVDDAGHAGARTRRIRRWLSRSLLAVPAIYLLGAVLLGVLLPSIDRESGGELAEGVGVGTARDILTSTATGMIAFTGLVIAGVLVVVQFAAGQYSPRLVLWSRHNRLVKHAIGSFLACWLYCLVALRQLDRADGVFAPDFTVEAALLLILVATLLFLALLQRATDRLRPRALYRAIAREGLRAVAAVTRTPSSRPSAPARARPGIPGSGASCPLPRGQRSDDGRPRDRRAGADRA